VIKGKLFV